MTHVSYSVSAPIDPGAVSALLHRSWEGRSPGEDYARVLRRGLGYVCAYSGDDLVGFVNVSWDGGSHGFILDTTVAPEQRRKGIGTELLRRAAQLGREKGLEWLHVDYPPELRKLYEKAGFGHTEAGLIHLGTAEEHGHAD